MSSMWEWHRKCLKYIILWNVDYTWFALNWMFEMSILVLTEHFLEFSTQRTKVDGAKVMKIGCKYS